MEKLHAHLYKVGAGPMAEALATNSALTQLWGANLESKVKTNKYYIMQGL